MAKLRNCSVFTLETQVSGVKYVTDPDGLLDVPDDVFLAHDWPSSLWDEVEVPRPVDTDDSVAAVQERVGSDPGLAQVALDAENASDKPRKTLVSYLETVISNSQEG